MRRLVQNCRSGSRQLAALGILLAAFGCAEKEMPAPFSPPAAPPASASNEVEAAQPGPSRRETGTASWYGREFHGRRTTSGELFDMHGLTAAHRTLPLGTAVTVTNLENLKSVTLRVNDRGPFIGSHVIGLSYGAARELGFAAQGTAEVRIESPEQQDAAQYTVQAAVFAEEENARLLKERLSVKFSTVWTVPFESNLGKFYRVFVGSYQTVEKAEAIAAKLKLEGLEPFVLRKD